MWRETMSFEGKKKKLRKTLKAHAVLKNCVLFCNKRWIKDNTDQLIVANMDSWLVISRLFIRRP